VNRLSQAVVMLMFGGAIVRVTLTDVFLRYVKQGLRPFLLAAGALLIATAVMTIWYELRTARARQEDDDGHGHAHHEPQVGWLLILPVLALLLVAPPALGSYSAGQAGTVMTAPSDSDYPPLPPGDPAPISLLDYASRAVYDSGKSLTGRTVRMSGFITPGPDGHPMLARIVLTCCAADGRPIKVGLAGETLVDAAPDTWVRVDGVYSSLVGKDPVNKADIAYVEVKSWQEITQPKQPYD
jgi:uncharacterized repeat protein (TIGR03943 family)